MRMSSRSLAVSAPAREAAAQLVEPLACRRARRRSGRCVCTCVPSTPVTSSAIRPSFSSSVSPGAHVARQRLVGDADHAVRAARRVEGWIEREGLALDQHRLARSRSARCAPWGRAGRRACRPPGRALAAAARARSMRRACSSKLPCEKLTRTRSTPAAIRSASAGPVSVAGPSVATIFVRLGMLHALAARRARSRARPPPAASCPPRTRGRRRRRWKYRRCRVLDAVLLDGGERVAAARDRERGAVRDCLGKRAACPRRTRRTRTRRAGRSR